MKSLLAYFHYIALGLAFASLFLRGQRFKESLKSFALKPIFFADNIWGISAALFIVTGLARVFGPYEKGAQYYLNNHWFYAKMLLFLMIFLLELKPMIGLIKWRLQRKTTLEAQDHSFIKTSLKINALQMILLFILPIFAVFMARGFV